VILEFIMALGYLFAIVFGLVLLMVVPAFIMLIFMGVIYSVLFRESLYSGLLEGMKKGEILGVGLLFVASSVFWVYMMFLQ